MAAIKNRHTKPEMIVRRLLHVAGIRFRLHRKDLPGKPDLTLKKWNAVIEVHGCFFHAHNCHLCKKLPSANAEFWSTKLADNVARDIRNADAIGALGLRRLVVWQCALTGKTRLDREELSDRIVSWLCGSNRVSEIRGSDLSAKTADQI